MQRCQYLRLSSHLYRKCQSSSLIVEAFWIRWRHHSGTDFMTNLRACSTAPIIAGKASRAVVSDLKTCELLSVFFISVIPWYNSDRSSVLGTTAEDELSSGLSAYVIYCRGLEALAAHLAIDLYFVLSAV